MRTHNSNAVSHAETLIAHFIPNHQSLKLDNKNQSTKGRTRRHYDKFGQTNMLKKI